MRCHSSQNAFCQTLSYDEPLFILCETVSLSYMVKFFLILLKLTALSQAITIIIVFIFLTSSSLRFHLLPLATNCLSCHHSEVFFVLLTLGESHSIWFPHLLCKSWGECSPHLCCILFQFMHWSQAEFTSYPFSNKALSHDLLFLTDLLLLWTSLSSLGLEYVPIWVTGTVPFLKVFLFPTCLTIVQSQNLYNVSPFFKVYSLRH